VFASRLPLQVADLGVVGNRSLRAFQMVRIGRHPASVFLLPRGGIWLVSGRGPGAGSNGAGKTVLLAALTLLNGDPQWRGEAGVGPYAVRLLFDRKRAKIGDTRHTDAARGYLIGVYLDSQHPDDAITVVMRIQRYESRYVQVRWSSGVLLAEGQTDEGRVKAADALWESMRGGEQLGPKNYAEVLFGSSPRCLAYIRARGSEDNQDTGILALGQRQFRPTDLANYIIALSGNQQAVNDERKCRQDLAEEKLFLTTLRSEDADLRDKENQQLADIAARKKSRAHIEAAAKQWQDFLSVGAVLEQYREADLLKSVSQLESAILETEKELAARERELSTLPSTDQLASQHEHYRRLAEKADAEFSSLTREQGEKGFRQRQLRELRDGLEARAILAMGLTLADAERQLQEAKDSEASAVAQATRQEEHLVIARQELEQIRIGGEGETGKVLAALESAGVNGRRLTDLITLDGDGEVRAVWEARLSPIADAVVVSASYPEAADAARQVLAQHPGVPALLLEQDPGAVPLTAPADGGPLDALLRTLAARMPETSSVSVFDEQLGLHIWGGFDVPLTDRRAAIQAAERRAEERRLEWEAAVQESKAASRRCQTAERAVDGTDAAAHLKADDEEAAQIARRLAEIAVAVPAAQKAARGARDAEVEAKRALDEHDKRRTALVSAINALKTDGDDSLAVKRLAVADARARAASQSDAARQWRQNAGIISAPEAEAYLAEAGIEVDDRSRDALQHDACSSLRQSIECVVSVPQADTSQDEETGSPGFGDPDSHIAHLTAGVTGMHRWCAGHKTAAEASMPFEAVVKPLADWLDWFGENDAADERDIHERRKERTERIAARERQSEQTRLWLETSRELQVQLITNAIKNAEEQLNDLLSIAGRDRVALRFTHVDLGNPDLPLRWEVRPEWILPEGGAVEYEASPNTAELIILHTLLAVSSMVSAPQPEGRMIVVDESGNNLDGGNLRKLAGILDQVAAQFGLSVVLACQDVYAHLIAPHTASVAKLLRLEASDVLNAHPVVVHGPDEPEVVRLIASYLT
jgi:hypothetical protein